MASRGLRLLAAVVAAAAAGSAVPPPAAAAGEPGVTIYYFWGDGCPHCAALRPFLDGLAVRDGVELAAYEVWYDDANRDLFARVASAHGVAADGVPAVFVAGGAWIGDSGPSRRAIEAAVSGCADGGCTDVAGAIVRGEPVPVVPEESRPESEETTIALPLVGEHDVGGDSLLWATVLVAAVDGFNPCSLWVLTVLLAMILRTGSRSRLAFVGGLYVTTVAAVYGLFLVGLFSALSVVDYGWWIRGSVAAFALAFAAVGVKDYVWYKRGVSFTIPERAKPGIVKHTRSLALERRRLPVVAAATVGLAAGVSLLELPCTVGFPLVWTNLVADRGVGGAEYAFLLGAYLLVFLLDEVLVLAAAVGAMRVGRLDQRHGRVLKLGGGMLMAVLGAVMLVDPGLLEDVVGASVAFAVAAALTALVLLADAGRARRRLVRTG